MSEKKKYKKIKSYKFDLEKGEYITKKEHRLANENPSAVIYVRVSDQKQVNEGNGLESQEATCRRWADNRKISILKVFSDSAISGANLERKGLYQAIEYLKHENYKYPKITYFLCTEISRISRSEDISQTMDIKKTIEKTGVEIITTHSGRNISNENPTESFMTDFDIIRAKHERIQIRERSLNGTKSKLHNGQRTFPPPVGYERKYIKNGNKKEKILELVEPQANIVKEGLEHFANGIFLNNIQLLEYFNKNLLTSNFHTPNPGNLEASFVARMLEIKKLYFYAGYIIYPEYGITKPIEAQHVPIISLQTVKKILNRLDKKGTLKIGPRKDTSELYPLRGSVICPYCNHPMTARPSTSKTGNIYHYYGCNRKDCRDKENINVEKMHSDFKILLESIKANANFILPLEGILKEVIKEKNKIQNKIKDSKKRRIIEIEKEIENYPCTISKLTKIEVIQRIEQKRSELEIEKELLEEEIKNKNLNEQDFKILYERIKNIIMDPISIWELGTTELKILLIGVLFGGKLYYKKNEGFQTPQVSAMYNILSHLSDGNFPSGADDGTRTRNILLGKEVH